MIYVKKRATNDLTRLVIRLVNYKDFPLTEDEAIEYVDKIVKEFDSLEKSVVRTKSSYDHHIKHGKYVWRYDKHYRIQWFIIYDIDKYENIVIKKILSNNKTKK